MDRPLTREYDLADHQFVERGVIIRIDDSHPQLKTAGLEMIQVDLGKKEDRETVEQFWACPVPKTMNLKVGDRVVLRTAWVYAHPQYQYQFFFVTRQ